MAGKALAAGADDYLVKPFALQVQLAAESYTVMPVNEASQVISRLSWHTNKNNNAALTFKHDL